MYSNADLNDLIPCFETASPLAYPQTGHRVTKLPEKLEESFGTRKLPIAQLPIAASSWRWPCFVGQNSLSGLSGLLSNLVVSCSSSNAYALVCLEPDTDEVIVWQLDRLQNDFKELPDGLSTPCDSRAKPSENQSLSSNNKTE